MMKKVEGTWETTESCQWPMWKQFEKHNKSSNSGLLPQIQSKLP